MRLDAAQLAAEADAKAERMRSPAWADPETDDGDNWAATLTKGVVEDTTVVSPRPTSWTARPSCRLTPEPSAQAADVIVAPSPVDLGEIVAQLDSDSYTPSPDGDHRWAGRAGGWPLLPPPAAIPDGTRLEREWLARWFHHLVRDTAVAAREVLTAGGSAGRGESHP